LCTNESSTPPVHTTSANCSTPRGWMISSA
jgi:hypothetical protein